ncbi:Protein angel homolog 2 [Geodia barretti]|uniref:Protein angel homolog 2 n=1 Tax=Geodia barretti TaxID=519541 RepID=A0AA35RGP2_GEOBA|nr:Protein angel homolog 2 [Geodia barretti]
MSGASGERGVSRGRGRGRRGRGRGWRGGERDRQSWGEVFAVGPAPGLRGSFPRPPGRGRGVELWPSLQPDHMPSWFSGPQWYPGRGRGFVQPPHFPPPAFAPTLYPSAPPRHPTPRHPSTLPRHPTPHGRGNPLLQRPWETINEPEQVGQTLPTILMVMTYNVLAQSLIDKNMHLYRNTGALYWESRRQLLLRELREARADIVCLQEVEEEHYHNWFLPNMSSLAFSGDSAGCG